MKFKIIIIWLCHFLSRAQILDLIHELINVLENKYPEIQPRDNFKEKYPHYRDFEIDPLAPLEAAKFIKPEKQLNYKSLLDEYLHKHGKQLQPVHPRKNSTVPPDIVECPVCGAPHQYLYFNNGKLKSQLKCKVCSNTFPLQKRFHRDTKYCCPYCQKHLFVWKERKEVTIYKCPNRNCPHRIRELAKLNAAELKLKDERASQFKLNYQYREYHYKPNEISIPKPHEPRVNLSKIHQNLHILALALTLHISYAITARKTAHMLYNVFGIPISYQTVLNYSEAAAYYCHTFNLNHKSPIDVINTGDETYIKVCRDNHYVWLIMSTNSHAITAYNLSDNRGVLPAIAAMLEVLKTAKEGQSVTFVVDGNPSYQAALHYINAQKLNLNIDLRIVIGLKNLDPQSKEYRAFKNMIERLNRTFKYHTQHGKGFKSQHGALVKLILFVTHYNFIRAHQALKYKTPIQLPELEGLPKIQDKWAKIISMAA